jgi:ribosome-binding factor A
VSRQSVRKGQGGRGTERDGRGGERPKHVPERSRPAAAGPGDGRAARVAARVRAELSDLILRGEVRDPAAKNAIVSSVDVTRDLSLVKVGLRSLDLEIPEAQRDRMVIAFKRAAGFLRARIGQALGLRQSPELRFAWDAGVDHAARVEALLRGDTSDDEEAP